MLFLSSTTDKLELVTSSVADIDYKVPYAIGDKTTSPMVVKDADTKTGTIAAATTTDISGSPAGANDRWAIGPVSIRNRHATTANDVTLRYVKAAGTAREIIKATLLAGYELIVDKTGRIYLKDNTGADICSSPPASDTAKGVIQLAVQTDMETATDVVDAVTAGRQHFHPGHPKCWAKVTVAAGTPTLATSYNVTSITDTATGQLTITINVDFSSANWSCQCAIERASTALTVANLLFTAIRFGGQAAGTVLLECWDGTAATAVAKDPTAWHMVGLGDL